MRPVLKRTLRYIPIFLVLAQAITTQGQFTGFGSKSAGSKQQSNDQKAGKLLHDKLPLVLDANTAYPTVPDQDMLGGPFRPRTLPVTLGSLTKPLPPGDYILPMTFFCSEYSVHRGGNGIAYQLGPAQGTAAKAISTLLWRGMLTGHKPQELQSVSWAIQGSVAYDKMPPKYKSLVDQLIPDMKNQVNGQAFADIEDGFQGKVNRVTKKISEGISKGTGGFVHADIKVDVELNESFERLGQVGRSALDGEKLNTIFTSAFPSDQAREQALYAGQGQQTAALPAANGPWSVKVPGVAYMRFVVHGGNLQGDNMMQIRILPPHASQALVDERPHLVLAGYEQTQQSSPSSPSVISLFNGSVNETALSQCQAVPVNQQMCMAQAITVSGDTGYSIGTGAQAPIMAPSSPITQQTYSDVAILLNGQDLSGKQPSLKVGEPVTLTATVKSGNGVLANLVWTISGRTVGGYQLSHQVGAKLPMPDLHSRAVHFFWVERGSGLNISLAYTLDSQPGSASASVDVGGPENVNVTATLNSVQLTLNGPLRAKGSGQAPGWWAMLGHIPTGSPNDTFLAGDAGIVLAYHSDGLFSSYGSFKWLQFVLKDDITRGTRSTHKPCYLDADLYYGKSTLTGNLHDSPGMLLNEGGAKLSMGKGFEVTRQFMVRTYLMWQSNTPDSIPVSMGYVQWGYSSDAVLTGIGGYGEWELRATPPPQSSDMVQDLTLPEWSPQRCPN